MKEPIVNPLISVSKKYLSSFSALVADLPIDRYQYVLVLIEENEETLTQKALSELLGIDKSYMVSIINYLSANEYVVREKNMSDRREQIIRLTDKARQDLPLIKEAFNTINTLSFKGLSEDQIENFNNTLDIIQNNLSNSPGGIFFDIRLAHK